jgi:sugar lactone lactonase YvrE
MNRCSFAIALAVSSLIVLSRTNAAEPKFVEAPKVTRAGDRWEISFAVNQTTDVEVAVLNRDGKVIRHLAAGVLGGKNPPPQPLQVGLQQSIAWDGKNDDGEKVAADDVQIRVSAGTKVRFGRLIGSSPYTGSVAVMPYRAPVNGLVTDEQGNLHVLMMSDVGSHGNSGKWPWQLRKFDPQGNYQRTLLPYPPSTKPAQASGYTLLPTNDNRFVPANQSSLYPVFATFGNEILPRLSAGRVVFVHSETRELNFFSLDGSNKLLTVPMWPASSKLKCPNWIDIQVALSPDGKTAYYSNVAGLPYDGKKPEDIDPDWPQGRIYRQDLATAGSAPTPLFDLTLPDFAKNPYWMPSAWDKKSAAAGIDTDLKGNVLVCDLVNHQIVEISSAGKLLSTTPVPWPDKVMVSRKTGDLYVVSRKVSRGGLPPGMLTKISGRGEQAKVVSTVELEGIIGAGHTLDESGKVPVLWLAGPRVQQNQHDSGALVRVEDRGDKLVITGDQFLNRDPQAITFVSYTDVDREAELIYVTRSGGTVWRYNGLTGEGGPLPFRAADVAIGPRGEIYTLGTVGSWEGPIARYSRDLKPIHSAVADANTYGYVSNRAGRGISICGLDVDTQGRVFATYGSNECHVRVFDPQGALVDFPRQIDDVRGKGKIPAAITGVTGFGGSLRVDRAGNIYLLQGGVPPKTAVPTGFDGDEAWQHAVGTIYKFPPSGGEINSANNKVKSVSGAVAQYVGCGSVSQWRAAGSCVCTKPRFDVDDFGRLYIPNAITFSVSMRDNADNEIVQFGDYGNFDCQGAGSLESQPAIPFGWAITASATDKHIYVGDCLNHRIVRVDKQFAATAIVKLPQ